jgi:protein-S-isoprenylcysteine O-methyltransferase Ste14
MAGKGGGTEMNLKALIGSGDKIMLLALPFIIVGLALNVLVPSLFAVGGPPAALRVISIILLVPGVAIWMWSVVLILVRVPQGKLITSGPYALAKHPLYTSVALLVLPEAGLLCDTWLGIALGAVIYIGSRIHSPEEERDLSRKFGAEWEKYAAKVKMPWL